MGHDKNVTSKTEDEVKPKTEADRGRTALNVLAIVIGVGIVGMLINALQAPSKFPLHAGVSLMMAGAALLCGGLLGFLFGIPRAPDENGARNNADAAPNYRANTNLEQISDWLTKILVGVGLTQLDAIPIKLNEVADAIAPGLGLDNDGHALALSAIVFFVIAGFLFGYLWTRLFLPGAFRQADLALVTKQIKKEIDQKAEQDAIALSLTHRQLDPSNGAPEVAQADLVNAIKSAAPATKVQIFNLAQGIRSATWNSDKKRMERAIPVFRALIEADPAHEFHRNHGQLGFALKDKSQPDWAEAEAQLTEAMRIRGSWHENGWLFYEFNRAICRIKLDPQFNQGKPSSPATRERILQDLAAVAQTDLQDRATKDPDIANWMHINNVALSDLLKVTSP